MRQPNGMCLESWNYCYDTYYDGLRRKSLSVLTRFIYSC